MGGPLSIKDHTLTDHSQRADHLLMKALSPTFTGNLSLVQLEASTAQFQRPYLNLVRSQMLPHTFQNLQDIGIVAMNTQGFRVNAYLRT